MSVAAVGQTGTQSKPEITDVLRPQLLVRIVFYAWGGKVVGTGVL